MNLTQAEKEYKELVEQYVSSGSVISGKPLPSPKRVLDREGMIQIKQAESKKQIAQKAFREALDSYYKSR